MKNKKLITIIFSFLNEGDYPRKTVESIYNTACSSFFNLIIFDDGSQDLVDLNWMKSYDDILFIRNEKKRGVQYCKQKGVELAQTEFILLIDAHMKFRNDNWLRTLVQNLENEPKTIFGVTCISMKNSILKIFTPKGYGANFNIIDKSIDNSGWSKHIINTEWNRSKIEGTRTSFEVSCLLGACYAFRRDWFLYIRGFEGLKYWGSTEPFLSIKCWLSGGKCKVIPSIEVEHKFRKTAPYKADLKFVLYNKLFLSKTLFGPNLFQLIVQSIDSSTDLKSALLLLKANESYVTEMRSDLQNKFQFTIDDYCQKFNIKIPKKPLTKQ